MALQQIQRSSRRNQVTELIDRIKKHVVEDGDCWVWQGCVQSCGSTPLIRYKGKVTAVRRAVLLDQGVVLGQRQATYTCDNDMCVNPEHTAARNRTTIQKRLRQQLSASDEILRSRNIAMAVRRSVRAKHSMEFARAVRAAEGTNKVIADQFNITPADVSAIRRRHIWKEYARCPLTGELR
jgi:hypothetical protein